MKKKFAALLAAAAMLTSVPALAATPDAAAQPPCWGPQQHQNLSDKDSNDDWYCGRGYGGRSHGYGPGCGRHDGSCWNNNQNQ